MSESDRIAGNSAGGSGAAPVRLRAAAAAVFRGWRALTATVVAGWLLTALLVLTPARRYTAEATVAAVTSRTGLSAAGGLAASLLGANAMLGLEATPSFLVRLARLDGVLVPVGLMRLDSAGAERVVDRLAGVRAGRIAGSQVGRAMRGRVTTRYDIQSGLISVSVSHRDSALARLVVNAVIEQVRVVFLRASRAQASQLRQGQEDRVDSASRRLREAEGALLDFARRHRIVSPFSEASLEQERLQRAVVLAQTVYTQAVTEREAAIAKELEATPALVVVDPPAAELPPLSRGFLTKLLLVTLVVGGAAVAVLVLRDPAA